MKTTKSKKAQKVISVMTCIMLAATFLFGCEKEEQAGSTSIKASVASATAKTSTAAFKTAGATVITTGAATETAKQTGQQSTAETSESSMVEESGVQSEEESPETDQTIVEEKSVPDFKGGEVVISSWIETNAIPPLGISDFDDIKHRLFMSMEERYNLKWKTRIITGTTAYYNELTAALLAGVYFADIAIVSTNILLPNLVKDSSRVFYAIDDYIDNSNSEYRMNIGQWAGKTYGLVPTVQGVAGSNSFVNQELLDREGFPDVLGIAIDGRWTWNKMLEIATSVTKDIDGDGIIDQWGIALQNLADCIVASNGVTPLIEKDGNFIQGYSEPYSIGALNFLRDLVNIYKVVDTASGSLNRFYSGKTAICFGAISLGLQMNNTHKMAKISILPLPMGPNADWYRNVHMTSFTVAAFPMTSIYDAQNLITAYSDAVMYADTTEPEHIPWNLHKEAQLEKWRGNGLTQDLRNGSFLYDIMMIPAIMNRAFGIPNYMTTVTNMIINPIVNQGTSVNSVIDTTIGILQGFIDSAIQ